MTWLNLSRHVKIPHTGTLNLSTDADSSGLREPVKNKKGLTGMYNLERVVWFKGVSLDSLLFNNQWQFGLIPFGTDF